MAAREIDFQPPSADDEQSALVKRIMAFVADPDVNVKHPLEFRFGGLAGVGKTTVGVRFIRMLEAAGYRGAFGAPTGKAVSVLQAKGVPDAGTLHSLFYRAEIIEIDHPKHGRVVKDVIYTPVPPGHLDYDFLFVDESSMIDGAMYALIKSHKLPTVYSGDHGQLPPVGRDSGLMLDLDACLETIHRQGDGSAILRAAYKLRSGARLTAADAYPGQLSVESIRYLDGLLMAGSLDVDIVLVAWNRTRQRINAICRRRDGFEGRLKAGERVVCLQNAHKYNVLNGQLFTVTDIDDDGGEVCTLHLVDDLGAVKVVPAWMGGFDAIDEPKLRKTHGVRFDFGHALTVHKSQGSEWGSVALVDELRPNEKLFCPNRWRYTGATRASERLRYFTL